MTDLVTDGDRVPGARRTRWLALGALLVCIVAVLAAPALANAPRVTATVVEATDNEGTGVTIKVLTVTNLSTVPITRIAGNAGTEHVLPAASCTGGEGFVCQITVAPGASQTICVASGRGAEYEEVTFADGTKESLESKGGGANVAKCPVGSFAAKNSGAKCVVPKLKGKKLKTAESALKSAHCAVGKIKKATSKHVKKGSVISSSPAAGKALANG